MLPNRGYLRECTLGRKSSRQQPATLREFGLSEAVIHFVEGCSISRMLPFSASVCIGVCVCVCTCVWEREGFQQGVFKTCCSLSRWSGRGFAYIHSWAYWSFNGTCRRLNEGESGWQRDEEGGKQGEQNTGRGRRRLSRQHISLARVRNFTVHSDKMAVKRLRRYFGYLLSTKISK